MVSALSGEKGVLTLGSADNNNKSHEQGFLRASAHCYGLQYKTLDHRRTITLSPEQTEQRQKTEAVFLLEVKQLPGEIYEGKDSIFPTLYSLGHNQ